MFSRIFPVNSSRELTTFWFSPDFLFIFSQATWKKLGKRSFPKMPGHQGSTQNCCNGRGGNFRKVRKRNLIKKSDSFWDIFHTHFGKVKSSRLILESLFFSQEPIPKTESHRKTWLKLKHFPDSFWKSEKFLTEIENCISSLDRLRKRNVMKVPDSFWNIFPTETGFL